MEMVKLVDDEDDDLADAELWAAIDSAAAISTRFPPKPLLLTHYPQPLNSSNLKQLPPSPPQPPFHPPAFNSDLARTPKKTHQIQSHKMQMRDSRQAFSEPKRRTFGRPVSGVYDQNKENCEWLDVSDDFGLNLHEMCERREVCENRGRQSSHAGRYQPKDAGSRESAMLIPVDFRERSSEGNSFSERKNQGSDGNVSMASWLCGFPSPSIFKQMQEAAMGVRYWRSLTI